MYTTSHHIESCWHLWHQNTVLALWKHSWDPVGSTMFFRGETGKRPAQALRFLSKPLAFKSYWAPAFCKNLAPGRGWNETDQANPEIT